MNELVKRTLIGLVSFIFVYLMGAFYNVSFDISNWSDSSRFIVSLFGGCMSIAFATFPLY